MSRNPEDEGRNPEDDAEDGSPDPEDGVQPRSGTRRYVLTPEGRARLSELGRARWTERQEAERRDRQLRERERRVAQAEKVPTGQRLQSIISRVIGELQEVPEGGLVRVSGRDYRLSSNQGLVHVYWPSGEKFDLEEGGHFQFCGRAYSIRDGRLRELRPSELLEVVVEREG